MRSPTGMAGAAMAAIVVGCAGGETERPAELPRGVAEAEEQGLVMHGHEDAAGLKRIVEHHFNNNALQSDVLFDRGQLENMGVDPTHLEDIQSLVQGIDVSVYRVEFMPGLTGPGEPIAPPLDVADGAELGDGGALTPAMPGRGSLVSHNPVSTYRGGRLGVGSYWTMMYSDGSAWTSVNFTTGDGGTWRSEMTTNADGSLRFRRVEQFNSAGERTMFEEESHEEGDSQAEEERRTYDGGGEGEGSEDPDDEDSGNTGDSEIDQYQPADESGSGVFCPLIVEICRRGLEEALASGERVKVGRVLVNPGDPDDQPEGSRLVYDPENLVINPEAASQANRNPSEVDPRIFKMEIPVWVLPPRDGPVPQPQ